MIPVPAYRGQRVAVFGLGRSGLTAAKALSAGGAEVLAWDDNEDTRERARSEGVATTDLDEADWSSIAALVLSPGVPLTHPEPHRMVKLAETGGVPVIGDLELFALAVNALPPGERPRVIGVTGTNGKSTTTALLGHLFQRAGYDAQIGGNIGRGVLDLDPPHSGAVYVLELSSYQLDLTHSLRCNAALLLNLSEDHIDRHGDMAGYIAAKKRIFRNQEGRDAAVIGVDDLHSKLTASERMAKGQYVIPISSGHALGRGVYAIAGILYDAIGNGVRKTFDMAGAPALRGRHNHQNAAAAFAAARALGLGEGEIVDGLKSFPGLVHRLELVVALDGVSYVNDSKATNMDAVRQALGAYDRIYWIAGGRDKGEPLDGLAPLFPRVVKAYLIGEAADRFARELEGRIAVDRAGDLLTAIQHARTDAERDRASHPVVLLSPGCASFDQFSDFEDRGNHFRSMVERITTNRALEGVRP